MSGTTGQRVNQEGEGRVGVPRWGQERAQAGQCLTPNQNFGRKKSLACTFCLMFLPAESWAPGNARAIPGGPCLILKSW
jgi:hypothetical protein